MNARISAACVLVSWWAGLPALPQRPVFRASADAILVDVSVRQRRRPVTGLTATDFDLLDANVPQTITAAVAEDSAPLHVTVLIDISDSVSRRVVQRAAAQAAETRQLVKPQDRLEIVAFNGSLREVRTAEDLLVDYPFEQRHTALWDAIACALMERTYPGRRVLVVTDGQDTSSFLNPGILPTLADRSDAVVALVAVAGGAQIAALYGGDWGPKDLRQFSWLLEDMARRTGGDIYFMPQDADFVAPLREAIGEFRSRYLLYYTPTGAPLTGWHELAVRVKKPGRYEVVARKGYQRQ